MLSSARPHPTERIIRIPALGLSVRVRVAHLGVEGGPTVIETMNAAGFGPLLYRRAEAEIFQVASGRYLFEVDGQRFVARRGDMVCVPGGAARAFVNITGTGARQQVIIHPGLDAAALFSHLADVLDLQGTPSGEPLEQRPQCFGLRWGIEFLGGPLSADVESCAADDFGEG
ncbi:Cupin domain-containing protein [Variovorax sp. OV329]|nr:Cupin domain-containing protein [Variovorax sp. OV329]